MKKENQTNIENLKNQRRLNVPEQIALKKHHIISSTTHWRKKGIPDGLNTFFKSKGIDFKTSILLSYEQDPFGSISTYEGIILTIDKKFYEFDLLFNSKRENLIEVYNWENISNKYIISEHKKGIKKTFGFLAIEVLEELNRI